MKTIINICIILSISVSSLYSQMMDLDRGRTTTLELEFFYGGITIIGTDTDRILIEHVKTNPVSPNMKKAVKPGTYKKSDLDINLNAKTIGNKVVLRPSEPNSQFADYKITVPKDLIIRIKSHRSKFKNSDWSEGTVQAELHDAIYIKNIEKEVEILAFSADVKLEDITGPITCTLHKGNIDMVFKDFPEKAPSAIALHKGDINIHLPEKVSCNLALTVFSGDINSEFDIKGATMELPDEIWRHNIHSGEDINKHEVHNLPVSGKINDGGAAINVSVFKGEINLFKRITEEKN